MKNITTLLTLSLISSSAFAQDPLDDLLDLPLTELQNRTVTSVSKKEERAYEAPASIYVITREDIKRSGATSIPELLRLVPGMQVAKMDTSRWSITSRGFAEQFSNKLLVLIDGRTVYNPVFSGVFWDTQDMVLEDIDRIEVIRGVGASLWGSNAVNGVINVISRNAEYTQGTYLSALYGNEEEGTIEARQGIKLSNNGFLRVSAKHFNRDDSTTLSGQNSQDDWKTTRVGFRFDSGNDKPNSYTLLGSAYTGRNEQPLFTPTLSTPTFIEERPGDDEVQGAHILGKWIHKKDPSNTYELQGYFDYVLRDLSVLEYKSLTADIDFQNNILLNDKHDFVWGVGYRGIQTELDDVEILDYAKNDRFDAIYSAFFQDKITLMPNKFYLTLGSRFEYNDFTNFEVQPNGRLTWIIKPNHVVWAAVSRAVRTPTIAEHSLSLSAAVAPPNALGAGSPLGFLKQQGSRLFDSEEVISYEVGHRFQAYKNLNIQSNAFFNTLKLRTFEVTPATDPDTALLVVADNNGSGETFGIELTATWTPFQNWTLITNYSFFAIDLHLDNNSSDFLLESNEGFSPHNQFNLQSRLNLTDTIELDNTLYYVDNLSTLNIPGYLRFDSRIAWKYTDNVELSIIGQNLFDDSHPEFSGSLFSIPTETERSIYGKVTWKF